MILVGNDLLSFPVMRIAMCCCTTSWLVAFSSRSSEDNKSLTGSLWFNCLYFPQNNSYLHSPIFDSFSKFLVAIQISHRLREWGVSVKGLLVKKRGCYFREKKSEDMWCRCEGLYGTTSYSRFYPECFVDNLKSLNASEKPFGLMYSSLSNDQVTQRSFGVGTPFLDLFGWVMFCDNSLFRVFLFGWRWMYFFFFL